MTLGDYIGARFAWEYDAGCANCVTFVEEWIRLHGVETGYRHTSGEGEWCKAMTDYCEREIRQLDEALDCLMDRTSSPLEGDIALFEIKPSLVGSSGVSGVVGIVASPVSVVVPRRGGGLGFLRRSRAIGFWNLMTSSDDYT